MPEIDGPAVNFGVAQELWKFCEGFEAHLVINVIGGQTKCPCNYRERESPAVPVDRVDVAAAGKSREGARR